MLIIKDIPFEVFALADYTEKFSPDGKSHVANISDNYYIPPGVDEVTLQIDRTRLSSTVARVIKCSADISIDGGITWKLLVSFTAAGEENLTKDGLIGGVSLASVYCPFPERSDRLIRINFVPLKSVYTKVELICANKGIVRAPPSDHHSLAYVQVANAVGILVTSLSTAAITSTSGSLLVMNTGTFNDTLFSSVSDSLGNSWALNIGPYGSLDSANTHATRQHSNNAGTRGAGHTFTIASTSNDYLNISVLEFTGQASGSVFDDGTAAGHGAGGDPSPHETSNTGTLAQANEVLVGVFNFGSSEAGTITTTGWTTTEAQNGGASDGQITGYLIVSSTAPTNATFTTSSSTRWAAVIGTYKEAAAGGFKAYWAHQRSQIIGAGLR